MQNNTHIVIGIDPGYERIGVCVMQKDTTQILHSDCIVTDKKDSIEERLFVLGQALEDIFKTYQPKELAIETLFFNKNTKTALAVSEARGVMLYLAKKHSIHVCEYSPQAIKIATTGYGKSDKKQVEQMTRKLLTIKKDIRYDDEIDAIAVALTHCVSS